MSDDKMATDEQIAQVRGYLALFSPERQDRAARFNLDRIAHILNRLDAAEKEQDALQKNIIAAAVEIDRLRKIADASEIVPTQSDKACAWRVMVNHAQPVEVGEKIVAAHVRGLQSELAALRARMTPTQSDRECAKELIAQDDINQIRKHLSLDDSEDDREAVERLAVILRAHVAAQVGPWRGALIASDTALSEAREMLGVFEDQGGHDGLGGKGYIATIDHMDEARKVNHSLLAQGGGG